MKEKLEELRKLLTRHRKLSARLGYENSGLVLTFTNSFPDVEKCEKEIEALFTKVDEKP